MLDKLSPPEKSKPFATVPEPQNAAMENLLVKAEAQKPESNVSKMGESQDENPEAKGKGKAVAEEEK